MFNFPDLPTVGDVYAPAEGPAWQWDGKAWLSLIAMPEPPLPDMFVGAQYGVGYAESIFYDGAYTMLSSVDIQLLAGNKIYYIPYRIRNKQIFNKIGFNVSTPYTALEARLGIYTAQVGYAPEYPGVLIRDVGILDVTTTGVREADIVDLVTGKGIELDAGEYWLALLLDGECEVYGNIAAQAMYKFGSTLGPGMPIDLLFSQEYEFATLPEIAGDIVREPGVLPNMSLRMATDV